MPELFIPEEQYREEQLARMAVSSAGRTCQTAEAARPAAEQDGRRNILLTFNACNVHYSF